MCQFVMSRLKQLQKTAAVKEKEIRKIQSSLVDIYKEIKRLRTVEFMAKLPSIITPKVFVESYPAVDAIEGLYKKLTNWFYENYTNKGLLLSGIPSEGGMFICLDQTKPVESQLGVLDFAKYVDRFGIMDTSCGLTGSYYLYTAPKIKIVKHRGVHDIIKEFNSMYEALEYIYKYLPHKPLVEESEGLW